MRQCEIWEGRGITCFSVPPRNMWWGERELPHFSFWKNTGTLCKHLEDKNLCRYFFFQHKSCHVYPSFSCVLWGWKEVEGGMYFNIGKDFPILTGEILTGQGNKSPTMWKTHSGELSAFTRCVLLDQTLKRLLKKPGSISWSSEGFLEQVRLNSSRV